MNGRLTKTIIIFTIVVWLIYDVFVGWYGEPTESAVIRNWGLNSTAFAWSLGFLIGHWFWPHKRAFSIGWMIALPFLIALAGWDVWWMLNVGHEVVTPLYRFPGVWSFVGIPMGALLWSQKSPRSPL